jgi:benzoate membrane transport protein
VLVTPHFTRAAFIGNGLPLFIVTMASQNIPGMAALGVNGYRPAAGRLFTTAGICSLLAAPFGGHAVNLAAITDALCAGPDAHPDPARRYWAAVVAGAFYVLFGLAAGAAVAFIRARRRPRSRRSRASRCSAPSAAPSWPPCGIRRTGKPR